MVRDDATAPADHTVKQATASTHTTAPRRTAESDPEGCIPLPPSQWAMLVRPHPKRPGVAVRNVPDAVAKSKADGHVNIDRT